jgi:hypothetical protein
MATLEFEGITNAAAYPGKTVELGFSASFQNKSAAHCVRIALYRRPVRDEIWRDGEGKSKAGVLKSTLMHIKCTSIGAVVHETGLRGET